MQERVKALPVQNIPAIADQKVITGEIVATSTVPLADYTDSSKGSGQNSEDVVTQLEKLAKLRELGVLEDAEFEVAKKKILGL